MTEINAENFETAVIKSGDDVIVSFTASWCGFCKNTEKMLAVAEQELKDIKFCVADVEKSSELAKTYAVRGVPTTLFFSAGELKNRRTGALTKAEIYTLTGRKPTQTADM